jgi:oligopeptide/dipeptide ABC transporter ATP-binding protein
MSADARELVVVDDAVKLFPLPRRGLGRKREHVHSLDGVSIRVAAGEVLGLVGESGSGKSTLARVVLGLVPLTSGRVEVDGAPPPHTDGAARRRLARTAQLVFQDPHAAMDPRMTLGESLTAVLTQHRVGTKAERASAVSRALTEVGLDDSYLDRYPGACSGGQLQRVVIARALLLGPKLLICDEPTSALDASVQARILNLLSSLRREHRLTMILISHDLRVVRFIGDRIAVMYLGQIVELAERDELFDGACHPYTLALLAAASGAETAVTGEPPSPIHPPAGCRFHPRCPLATDRCRTEVPEPEETAPGHRVSCHRWREARAALADGVAAGVDMGTGVGVGVEKGATA